MSAENTEKVPWMVRMGLRQPELSKTFVPVGSRKLTLKKDNNYLSNVVSTGKYSAVTFLPKFLFEFFSKAANVFFLFTGTIQLIPDLSPFNRFGTILPLTFIGILVAAKELSEDRKRHQQDRIVNARLVKVFRNGKFEKIPWREVIVGDILRVENGQYFPADLIALSSSEPDALCYIETANLDGETNLKIRQGIPETAKMLTPGSLSRLEAEIESELPNNSLYTFEAVLKLNGRDYALSPNQLLLRGAQLKNTRWVYAAVVFTGHETKLMKNSTATPIKQTKIEKLINSQIALLFFLVITVALICAIGQYLIEADGKFFNGIITTDLGQQKSQKDKLMQIFPHFLTFIILFNNFIPLSLIVTVEFVRLALAFFINFDLDMYYDVNDTPATARTSSLVEELGQVDYIFSDKTGTLTRNIMEFKMSSIGGTAYAETVPEDKTVRLDEHGNEVGFYDMKKLIRDLHGNNQQAKLIEDFLTLLAVCHTVIPERMDDSDPTKITYQASSPDEAALVDGAKSLGFVFHTRKPKSVTISVEGRDVEYEILTVNEFNSTRKRMSVLVRDPSGNVKLLIKGADTVIYERLKPGCTYIDKTSQHLEEYALEGLRTLVLASRDIGKKEYEEWRVIFEKANTQINDRQSALDAAAELIEKDLTLLGATAIEDKLQDGVPEAISTLMDGGIKIWVLTGDRQETAINIGYSCKLITPEMKMMICNEKTHDATKKYLETQLSSLKSKLGVRSFEATRWQKFWLGIGKKDGKFDKNVGFHSDPMALVIDGSTLNYALEDDTKEVFLELAMLCKAVVCCRVSPLQKALVVKLVKSNVAGSVTLAIGDGANDVSMIQAAHIGVGISGQEGLQAARSADFAIAQFRFLRKLLLVHGGWAYSRISKTIVISFYKNITLYFMQFWFALFNGFSGMSLFETWSSVTTYNVAWTALPPIAIGMFDQYVSAQVLDKYPQLYRLGQADTFYNHKVFVGWIANSLFHSFGIFGGWYLFIGESDIMSSGLVIDNWVFGSMVYFSVLFTVLIKHCLIADNYNRFTAIAFFGSITAYFILFPIYVFVGPKINVSPELFNLSRALFLTPNFWFGAVCLPVLLNLRDIAWKFNKRSFKPKEYHILQEIQKLNIPHYTPTGKWFTKAVKYARAAQNQKRNRGFAFSQNDGSGDGVSSIGQLDLVRLYDTTVSKPKG